MALTAEERVIYTARLSEAETALHQLMLGQTTRVYVDQNGERIEFNLNSKDSLRAYIMELKVALGISLNITGPLKHWMVR
jgi:hypothetical protein